MVENYETTSSSSKGSAKETISKLDEGYSESAIGQKDIADVYNEIGADQYDEWAVAVNWNAPNYLVQRIGSGCVLDVDPASEILDVGAGSGVIGRLLLEKGFSNITGIDASEAMLKKAKETGAYKATHCMYVGMGVEKFLDELKGRFDIVTACGCFIEGHIPATGFDDVHAALKTGGHFVINFKECNWVEGAKEGYKEKLA